jgi:tRNA-2-methylthio-N6-dimethylallyladenosine synthase
VKELILEIKPAGQHFFPQTAHARALLAERFGASPVAFVHSFGCQQNAADTEKITGLLMELGFSFCDDAKAADLIVFNTCAVRKSAEERVYGHIGALKSVKAENPRVMIAVCGCMTQREEAAQTIKDSYPYVDIVLGTGAVHRLAGFLCERIEGGRRVFWNQPSEHVVENIPTAREPGAKAWLPIMQGCDNFCSYCIVPHVRGREVSRDPGAVVAEAREILSQDYREITLLGQNVNSYGKGLAPFEDFPGLIRRLDEIEGDHWFRFMTSHPKDCTFELLDTLAKTRHFCRHIHLPVQSGADRVLAAMNRRYTAGHYLELIEYARRVMPGITFSSDIIVGFPGETREDFEKTLELVRAVRYNALFTFIYSKRAGTAAEQMADPISSEEKSRWFRELLQLQQNICSEKNAAMVGKTLRVLVDSRGKTAKNRMAGREEGNIIVEFEGAEELIGRFVNVLITQSMNWALTGRIV